MTIQEFLLKMYARACRTQNAHYTAASRFERLHNLTGYPSGLISAIVATAVFTSLSETEVIWLKIATSALAVLASVGTFSVVFFSFKERSQKHREAGAGFAELKRSVEILLVFPPQDPEAAMKEISLGFDTLTKAAPIIPDTIWKRYEGEEYTPEGIDTGT